MKPLQRRPFPPQGLRGHRCVVLPWLHMLPWLPVLLSLPVCNEVVTPSSQQWTTPNGYQGLTCVVNWDCRARPNSAGQCLAPAEELMSTRRENRR